MTNLAKKLCLVLSVFLLMPLVVLLSGCGATAVNNVKGVSFVSSMHDENGTAIFELDLNSPVVLSYKINPSSAYGYTPRFSSKAGTDVGHFSLYPNGEICITSEKFGDNVLDVEVAVGEYKDTCKVKLKKYPTEIGLYDDTKFNSLNKTPEINLSSGSSYHINIAGIMKDSPVINTSTGEKQASLLLDSNYNFLVEADENSKTLINIPNERSLNFVTYDNYGTAKVKVALCDYFGNVIKDDSGNALYAIEITVNIHKPCKTMDVKLSGADKIISTEFDNQTCKISTSLLTKVSGKSYDYVIDFDARFYDKYEKEIPNLNISLNCSVDDDTFITVDNDAQKIYLTVPNSNNSFDATFKIWSNVPLEDDDGFCMASFKVTFEFDREKAA